MTTPVTLYGTQANGETLPVQVDATGRLVAEGLEGPPGPQGDPFTYEDFTPEQLADLQGPPGEPGQDGADGPNDLKPYGPEWSYLIIQNGKPTWVSDGSDPQPPGPTAPVMLMDKRDEPQPSLIDFGMWSEVEAQVQPLESWDAYARQLETWNVPAGQQTGLGALSTDNYEVVLPFQLNVIGGLEKVLEIVTVPSLAKNPNNANSNPRSRCELVCSNEHVQVLQNVFENRTSNTSGAFWVNTNTFYLTRPDLGYLDFTFSVRSKTSGEMFAKGAWVQRWRLIDPAVYLMNRHVQRLQARGERNS